MGEDCLVATEMMVVNLYLNLRLFYYYFFKEITSVPKSFWWYFGFVAWIQPKLLFI